MIGRMISHYRVIGKLGEGGMGVVYKAEDTRLDRTVALKFLSPRALGTDEEKARFVTEAKAAAVLNHPNICTVYEIDEANGQAFIAMALIEGESVRKKIDRGPLELREAIDIAAQVADGLSAAHDRGVIHRDIKPGNVMVTPGGRVKIMDFGLAKIAGSRQLTAPGAALGTASYMSPEQARGLKVDHRTDIWSLGALLYEMLTGREPFPGERDQAIIRAILSEAPVPITAVRTGVPVELERIALKAMAKDPRERYQHADEMVADLKALARARETGVGVRPGVRRSSAARMTPRRLPRWSPIVIAVGAAAVIAGWALVGLRGRTSQRGAETVVVADFENRTGDSSLDLLSDMAADRIAQGLTQTGVIDVVPAVLTQRLRAGRSTEGGGFQDMSWLGALAGESGARVVVSGAYYLEGDSLRFHARATDTGRSKLIYALRPVSARRGRPSEAIEEVRQRMMGLLATDFDPAFDSRPPRYDAYLEYMAGWELWGADFAEAGAHFRRATEHDPTYFYPRLMMAIAHSLVGEPARADTIVGQLNAARERLTGFERVMLDWGTSFCRSDLGEALRQIRRANEMLKESRPEKLYLRLMVESVIAHHAIVLNRPREALEDLSVFFELFEEWQPRLLTRGASWETWARRYQCVAYHMVGDHVSELASARRAAEHYPDRPQVRLWEVRALIALGRLEEADRIVSECLAICSETEPPGVLLLGAALELRAHGHREEGIAVANRGVSLYETRCALSPGAGTYREDLANLLYAAERWEEAEAEYADLATDASMLSSHWCRGRLAILAARMGDRERALGLLAEDEQLLGPEFMQWNTMMRARVAAILGEQERAVELLREAVAQGYWLFYGLRAHTDMDLESLRGYPAFEEFTRPKG